MCGDCLMQDLIPASQVDAHVERLQARYETGTGDQAVFEMHRRAWRFPCGMKIPYWWVSRCWQEADNG